MHAEAPQDRIYHFVLKRVFNVFNLDPLTWGSAAEVPRKIHVVATNLWERHSAGAVHDSGGSSLPTKPRREWNIASQKRLLYREWVRTLKETEKNPLTPDQGFHWRSCVNNCRYWLSLCNGSVETLKKLKTIPDRRRRILSLEILLQLPLLREDDRYLLELWNGS